MKKTLLLPILMILPINLLAQETVATAPAKDPLRHFNLRCKAKPKPDRDAGNREEQGETPTQEINEVDPAPQSPILSISDFPTTLGQGNIEINNYGGVISHQGQKTYQDVAVFDLGVCDYVDVGIEGEYNAATMDDGTKVHGMGNVGASIRWNYYSNEDNKKHPIYASVEVAISNSSASAQANGIGDPKVITIDHQIGVQVGQNKYGSIYANAAVAYAKSMDTTVLSDNVSGALSLGIPVSKNISVMGEVGVGQNVGQNNDGAHQVFESVGVMGKLSKCSKWMLMFKNNNDSIEGNSKQVFLGIRTAFNGKSRDCAL